LFAELFVNLSMSEQELTILGAIIVFAHCILYDSHYWNAYSSSCSARRPPTVVIVNYRVAWSGKVPTRMWLNKIRRDMEKPRTRTRDDILRKGQRAKEEGGRAAQYIPVDCRKTATLRRYRS
jgi:hypothetical protein